MYGDTEMIRRHAARLREQGVEIRSLADRLVAQVEQIAWTGRAADTMRERVRDRAGRLRVAADRHDAAAESLERHVVQVDAVKDAIAGTERTVAALQADARARISSLQCQRDLESGADAAAGGGTGPVQRRPDPVDLEIAALVPPVPGHQDWLHVDLPGS